MKPYKNIKPANGNEYIDMYKQLHTVKEPKQTINFADDKPLVLPEFDLKQGTMRDILESKRPK